MVEIMPRRDQRSGVRDQRSEKRDVEIVLSLVFRRGGRDQGHSAMDGTPAPANDSDRLHGADFMKKTLQSGCVTVVP
jgi:hypothetical protein